MISFAVVIAAALAVLAVTRARRRTEVLVYAWLMPVSTVVQAVIGGITVRTGLLWWTVAIHLLTSMTMVWLSVLLYVKVGEPDNGGAGVVRDRVARPLRALTALTAVNLAAVLVTGTLVTAAGPHAGDRSPSRTVPRLKVEITTLVHAHSSLLVSYLALLVGLGFGLLAVGAARAILLRLGVLVALVCAQAAVGTTQYFTGVPAALVAVHVAGAAACTAATAALWASMRERAKPEPLAKLTPRPARTRRWARSRVSASNSRQPSDGATRCSSSNRGPVQMGSRVKQFACSDADLGRRGSQRGDADVPEFEVGARAGNACDGSPPRKTNTVSGAESACCTNTLRSAACNSAAYLAAADRSPQRRVPVPVVALTKTSPVCGSRTRSPGATTSPGTVGTPRSSRSPDSAGPRFQATTAGGFSRLATPVVQARNSSSRSA